MTTSTTPGTTTGAQPVLGGSTYSTSEVVRLVAAREVRERLRDRAFLVSTGVTLLIVLAIIILPRALGWGDPPSYDVAFGPGAEDYAEVAEARAQALDVDVSTVEVAADAARDEVSSGDLDAYVTSDGILVQEDLDVDLAAVLQGAAADVRSLAALEEAGLSEEEARAARDVPPLPVEATEQDQEQADNRTGLLFIGTFLLYGQLIGYGFWVATGVVEEKASRVVEVLLAAIRPRALLAGKVLGVGLLGLGQLLALGVVGVAVAQATGALDLDGDVLYALALLLGWFVLGYAFYACMFAAAAARVSRLEDLQNATGPANLLVIGSFLGFFAAFNEPDGTVARVLAVLPPFSALVNPTRMVNGDAAVWELGLAVVLMLAATTGLVLAAARLYEGAILRMGAAVPMREAWRARAGRAR